MRTKHFFALVLALTAGCDPERWDELRSEASVILLSPTSGQAPFGSVLATYGGTVDGEKVSRIAVAGGVSGAIGTSFHAYAAFDDLGGRNSLTAGGPVLFTGCQTRECGDRHGAALASFPTWTLPSGERVNACVATTSLATGGIHLRCEDREPIGENIAGPADEDFGASAVGIDAVDHPLGVALFGAPRAAGGDGRIYRLPSGGVPEPIDLSSAELPSGAGLGTVLDVHASPTGLLVAAGARGADRDRVVVATMTARDRAVVRVHACLELPQGELGALTLGDLDGDGVPELVVGGGIDTAGPRIRIYDGAAFADADSRCGEAAPEPVRTLGCGDVQDADIGCDADAPSALGAALAIGDVDADGRADLVAGAPFAAPGGLAGAGAVVIFGGSESLAALGTRQAALYYSGQERGAQLGRAVAVVTAPDDDGTPRVRVVAGAPGARQVALFLCSGLGDDMYSPERSRGCL